jgi:ribosomal protein S18 acetylase RimI-like enzyme
MIIKSSQVSDAMEVTNLHFSSGVAGILGKLSPKLLCNNFYIPLLTDPKVSSITAFDTNHKIQGFLSFRGEAHMDAFSLPKKNTKLFLEILGLILRNPANIRIIFNVLWTEKKTSRKLKAEDLHYGEIQILIVGKDSQGMGIGSKLMVDLIQKPNWSNLIVKTQSEEARHFYSKHGFVQVIESKFFGSRIYVLSLRKGSRDGH